MTTHCTDRLSEYLDGDLPPAERDRVAAHLAACGECAGALADLQTVVGHAHALPPERPPAGDPWPGVAARIGARPSRGSLLPWRVTLSLPQLAAAAVVLVAAGMGGMWLQMNDAPASNPAPAVSAGTVDAVPAALADESFDAVLADLETALDAGRDRLDPRTVEVLEANLAAIDAAIAQATEALAADPANVGLTRHLVRTRALRVALLRRAVAATEAAG